MNNNNKKAPIPVTDWVKLCKHIVIISVLIALGATIAHFGLVLFTRHNAHCTVPEFKGLLFDEAEYMAADNDLKIVINDSLYVPMYDGGLVLDQLPKAGVGVKPGRTIYVTINAFGAKMVTVPYVAGRSLRQAKNMLEVAGLQIEKLVYQSDMATNYVLAEYCGEVKITEDSQHDVVIGSGITLYVGMSKNSNMTIVPQLIGLTLREAKSRLWELGFNVGRISYPEDSTPHNQDQSLVYSQGVSKGEELRLGRSVSLKLTFDKAVVDEILEAIAEQEREEEEQRLREEDSLARLRIMDLFDQKINGESQQGAVEVQEENLDSFFE